MTVSNELNHYMDELFAQRVIVYFMASFGNAFDSKQNANKTIVAMCSERLAFAFDTRLTSR